MALYVRQIEKNTKYNNYLKRNNICNFNKTVLGPEEEVNLKTHRQAASSSSAAVRV